MINSVTAKLELNLADECVLNLQYSKSELWLSVFSACILSLLLFVFTTDAFRL